MNRIWLGGLLGGLLLFAWGAVSHMLTPIGEAGMRSIPGEAAVVAALRDAIDEDGMYAIPGAAGMTDEQRMHRVRQGPSGLLVYRAGGIEPMSPRQLLTELASNVACAFVAACLLAATGGALRSYGARVVFVALLGFVAWLSIEVSYWNWYGFPTEYALAQLVEQVVGFALAGLAVAACVRPATRSS